MENNHDRLVSVIVPVYNGGGFITDTLESVKGQTHKHLECIVVDDGSTDDTAAVVKAWIGADARFAYIFQSNKGLSGARNTGLEHAKGDYIQFLDADDVLLPSKIEEQLKALPEAAAVVSYTDYSTGTSADIFTPSGYYRAAQFNTSDWLSELIARWESSLVIPPHCFLFSAVFFRDKGIRFDTSLPNHEDFDCWVRIFRLNPRVQYIDRKLCIYRITDGSMSKKMRLMGDGFLQVLDQQLQVGNQSKELKSLLTRKRREVLRRYNRFDRMSFMDKIFMFRYVSSYYSKRILQKAGFKP
jgi:glycosyltransferase involved in cell wall biosynthesis